MITYMMMLFLSGQIYFILISSFPTSPDCTRYHRHPDDIHSLMIYWFDIFWNNTEVRDAASSLEPTSHQQTQQLYFETPLVWTWTLIHSQILTHNHTPLNSESSLIHYKITMYNCSYCSLLERQRTSLLLTDPEIPSKVISSSPQSIHPWVHRNKI